MQIADMQKYCLVTEQTQFTDNAIKDAIHFEGQNVAIQQMDKVPMQAVSLIFSNCSLYSCKGLNFHVLVTFLDLSNNLLDSIAGLSGLNLEYVDLSGNFLTDVSILSTCSKIQVLKLNNNQIFKLDLLQNLPQLTELEFENNQVQFLKPIITHENFDVEWLSTQKLILIQQLMDLLNVSKEKVTQYQSECEPWKYKALMLIRYRDKVINESLTINDDQQLTSIYFIDYLNVTKLIVNRCHKINFAEAPMKLKNLQVCLSNVQSLQGIQQFQQLETLVLRNNSLHRLQNEIQFLADLHNLKLLSLAQNQLKQVFQFQKLNQLESLDLSENQLQTINQYAILKLLKNLDVSFNLLENIEEFKECLQLEQLNIANNNIKNIHCLDKLTNLIYFNISNNRIQSIEACLQMKQLVDLRTNNNVIQDLNELCKHENSCAHWMSVQDVFTDEEIKGNLNCDDNELPKKKIQYLDDIEKSRYCPNMVVKYKLFVVNESLEIKNDDKIQSVAFVDLLKVNSLSIIECINISFGQYPKSVQHLSAFKCQLSNVNDLEQITQLVSLDLSGNSLRYVSQISELVLLKQLVLKDNQIAYIGNWISDLQILEHLDMENNRLLTVKQLLDLPKLETVVLNGNMVMDIDYLFHHINFNNTWWSIQIEADLPDYEYYLGSNKNDKTVKNLMKLLQLEKYSLKNAIKYENLINDQELVIHGDNYLCDLGFIDPKNKLIKKNINAININYCNCVETYNTPQNLTKLSINNSGLANIKGLEQVQNLVSVNLSLNNLSSVEQLENLIYIEELFINDNIITRLDCLEKLTNLRTLEVKNNKLLKINVARFWIQIIKLFVDQNIINDFSALFNHMSYNPMWISKQNIATIADIKNYIGQEASQSQIDAELAMYNNQSAEKRKVDQEQIQANKKKIRINEDQNKYLNIDSDPEIRAMNFVNYFRLETLTIRSCYNVNFDYICNVTILHVTNSGLTKLDGIQRMVQLQDLDVSYNQLTNASLIAYLVNLQKLNLRNNKLLEVDFVKYLNDLNDLGLRENMIYRWETVKYPAWVVPQNQPSNDDIINRFGVEQLQNELTYIKNSAEQKIISKLQLQTQITVFGISQSESDLIQIIIENVQNCERETVSGNCKITCQSEDRETVFDELKEINSKLKLDIEEIRYLKINYDDETYDFSLFNTQNIQKLVVQHCQNIQLDNVVNSVKSLHFNWCAHQNIEGIQKWNKLMELNLDCNKLENINLIQNLTQLKFLSLNQNEVQNLWPLRNLKDLKELRISENQIQNLEPLKDLENIIYLSVSYNLIKDVQPLQRLTNLIDLSISRNYIKDFTPISQHPNFKNYKIQEQRKVVKKVEIDFE
ncbi:Leucine_rich repeats-containing protein [Hexamita inflata]|uniref:Leucine rich repeats-containing protein n=1 Tax=Hexamita inflata TaxID=28002 RepID=A0AA86PQW0_9EUKA|nr:Leucine rich repeats-containing protein [Hexamita inflata]